MGEAKQWLIEIPLEFAPRVEDKFPGLKTAKKELHYDSPLVAQYHFVDTNGAPILETLVEENIPFCARWHDIPAHPGSGGCDGGGRVFVPGLRDSGDVKCDSRHNFMVRTSEEEEEEEEEGEDSLRYMLMSEHAADQRSGSVTAKDMEAVEYYLHLHSEFMQKYYKE